MGQENKKRFKFQPLLSVFALVLVSLFIALGNWQLTRAGEKEQIHLQKTRRANLPPVVVLPSPSSAEQLEELAEKPVRVQGEFENQRQILLQNQIRTRQIGMYVLTVFRIADTGQRIMVNRGWVAGEPGRFPVEPLATHASEISGWLRPFPGTGYEVKQLPPESKAGMQVLLTPGVTRQELESFVGMSLYPMMLYLNESSAGGFDRIWPPIPGSADRHRAYAAQWFLFAFLTVVFYVLLSFRKYQ